MNKVIEFFDSAYWTTYGFFQYTLWYNFRKFNRFVYRMPSLIKAGWENESDFDWYAPLGMLIFKLERLRNHIATHQHYVGWDTSVTQIDQVIDLFKRSIDDGIELPEMAAEWKAHHDKYGDYKISFGDNNKVAIEANKFLTEEEMKQEPIDRIALYHKEGALKNEMWDKAMDLLKTNMRSWWC